MARRVAIVDFASDAREVPCGRRIAPVLPDDVEIEILRGTRPGSEDEGWAAAALARASHVILSGSDVPTPRDEPWFASALAGVRRIVEAGVPMLGVCFGHQIIAQALGGPDMVRRARFPEYGIARLRFAPEAAADPVIGALAAAGDAIYALHMDEVVESAASALGLDVLAESARCANHAYRLAGRPVWAVQGHPEIARDDMAEILERRPAAGDDPPGAPPLERDVRARPCCRRTGVFDAFLDQVR